MSDRYWNPDQPARRYGTHEEEIEEDVPKDDLPGWRLPTPSAYLDRDGRSSRIVTRPSDYVPYQSIVQPDGRHAYDPAARQYPQPFREERRSGRVAHRAADRQNLWNSIRPNPMYHPPGATIELPYRDDPLNMPPPPAPPATAASRDQAAGFMQRNPYPTQRPGVGADPATRQAGQQRQPLQDPRQGPVRRPPFAAMGGMRPPPLPQAGVRGRSSDPNLRSAGGEYGNSQARESRSNRGNRGGRW